MKSIFGRHKSASLQLSINAIVIVVLAFVLLGLGLGFIRNQFKDIGSTTTQVQEQVKQQILEDLRTGDKKLSFPSSRIKVTKGDTTDIAIGVKNTLAAGKLRFFIDIHTAQAQTQGLKCSKDSSDGDMGDVTGSGYSAAGSGECETDGIADIGYFFEPGPFELGPADSEVFPISLNTERVSDTYLVKLTIYQLEDDADSTEIVNKYAEKTFFVQVS